VVAPGNRGGKEIKHALEFGERGTLAGFVTDRNSVKLERLAGFCHREDIKNTFRACPCDHFKRFKFPFGDGQGQRIDGAPLGRGPGKWIVRGQNEKDQNKEDRISFPGKPGCHFDEYFVQVFRAEQIIIVTMTETFFQEHIYIPQIVVWHMSGMGYDANLSVEGTFGECVFVQEFVLGFVHGLPPFVAVYDQEYAHTLSCIAEIC